MSNTGFDSEFVLTLNFTMPTIVTSRAKATEIFGHTEELMDIMHAGRKMRGQTEN